VDIKQQVLELLTGAKDLISDESHWCQNISAVDKSGVPVGAAEVTACKWCASSALAKLHFERSLPEYVRGLAVYLLSEGSLQLFEEYSPIYVNDAMTHEAVMKVYDKAISNAQERLTY
jgi:hypothetical protein